jgi:hypothetical protein
MFQHCSALRAARLAVGDHHRRGRGPGLAPIAAGSQPARAYTRSATPRRDFRYIEINRRLRELHPRIVAEVVAAMQRLGGTIRRDPKTTADRQRRVHRVQIACCLTTMQAIPGLLPDTVCILIHRRCAPGRGQPRLLDYYLLPAIAIAVGWPMTTASASMPTASRASTTCSAWPSGCTCARQPEPMGGDVAGAAAPPALPARVAAPQAATVRSIPVHRARVLIPRSRSKKTFAEIVDNITALGLKRPITVTIGGADDDGPRYDLVCGQAEEAYRGPRRAARRAPGQPGAAYSSTATCASTC